MSQSKLSRVERGYLAATDLDRQRLAGVLGVELEELVVASAPLPVP